MSLNSIRVNSKPDSTNSKRNTEFETDMEFETGTGNKILIPNLRIGDRSGFEEISEQYETQEEVFLPDDRKPILDTTPVPFRFICHIRVGMKGDDGRLATGIGTGTLIGNSHVLTVGHNLKRVMDGTMFKAAKVTVCPGRNTSGSLITKWSPFNDWEGKSWNVHTSFNGKTDTVEFDYALIALKKEAGKKQFKSLGNKPLGYWGSPTYGGGTVIIPVGPSLLKDKIVNVGGYPFDKCGKDPDKPSCLPKKRQGTQFIAFDKVLNASPPAQPRLLDHRADMKIGQSGSPVWWFEKDKKRRCLVSIQSFEEVSSTGTPIRNSGPRITAEVLKQLKTWGWPG